MVLLVPEVQGRHHRDVGEAMTFTREMVEAIRQCESDIEGSGHGTVEDPGTIRMGEILGYQLNFGIAVGSLSGIIGFLLSFYYFESEFGIIRQYIKKQNHYSALNPLKLKKKMYAGFRNRIVLRLVYILYLFALLIDWIRFNLRYHSPRDTYTFFSINVLIISLIYYSIFFLWGILCEYQWIKFSFQMSEWIKIQFQSEIDRMLNNPHINFQYIEKLEENNKESLLMLKILPFLQLWLPFFGKCLYFAILWQSGNKLEKIYLMGDEL